MIRMAYRLDLIILLTVHLMGDCIAKAQSVTASQNFLMNGDKSNSGFVLFLQRSTANINSKVMEMTKMLFLKLKVQIKME